MPGIVPLQFVPVYQAHVAAQPGQKAGELTDIVLSIAIGVRHQLLGGRRESGAQSLAIAQVAGMRNHAHARGEFPREISQHFAGRIATAIVDDDHLVIAGAGTQHRKGLLDQRRERRRVVVSGKKNAQRLGRS